MNTGMKNIFRLAKQKKMLEIMKRQRDIIFEQMIEELWKIRNPNLDFDNESYQKLLEKMSRLSAQEKNNNLRINNLDVPTKKACFELSTARNRNLIDPEEQNMLRESVIAFFGLSVGSHAAITWMMESRADAIKIVDPDKVSASNLNRLRNGWKDIGRYKVELVEEELYEINPFTKVYSYYKGDQSEIIKILDFEPEADVIIDEIDDFEVKIALRKIAKERKIPLISAADVGDNVVLDIERYDLLPQPEMFLGRIPEIENINFSKLTDKEKKKLIIKLVGFETNSEKMINSLFAINASIVTWPQLGATATITGGIIATAIKKIILGEKVISGRYYISLDDILVSDFNSWKSKESRNKKINRIKELLKE